MNLDQQFLRQHEKGSGLPIAVNSTALATSLETKLEVIDLSGPRLELSFKVGTHFLQAEDVVHGGALTTMLDFAMAYAALLAIPDGLSVATINMNVAYLRSAKIGGYRALAEIERCGKNVVFARAQLQDRDKRAIATATSSLAIVRPRRKLAMSGVAGAEPV
ncbi:PaaI family thioesterase [Bradyrhizobium sp. STM 3561]|uniref:PaaI family thioesterase n=1 Tax=unclassified Bradyrhizobium TaxID=2631580 RepID=UPI00388D576B